MERWKVAKKYATGKEGDHRIDRSVTRLGGKTQSNPGRKKETENLKFKI
jgi:hypothetical protein